MEPLLHLVTEAGGLQLQRESPNHVVWPDCLVSCHLPLAGALALLAQKVGAPAKA